MDLHTTISAAAAGDANALNALFERNLPLLEAFLRVRAGRALQARESIRDLAQSVCREVLGDWEKIELRSEKEFRNYLFLEAGRKILKKARFHAQERRDARREAGSLDTDEAETLRGVYASVLTPSRCADAREEVAAIEDAIAELPEAQRDAITLTRLLGLTTAEAAVELEVSESAVRGLIARGLARIAALRSAQRGEG
ncbi:MAG: sigma-70 family RNA polymerase sigma factor [Planctomycetes bacterium]|nr:sigma-70 family RNA polymerase sigma factor [Planctomycetota bacterium]